MVCKCRNQCNMLDCWFNKKNSLPRVEKFFYNFRKNETFLCEKNWWKKCNLRNR